MRIVIYGRKFHLKDESYVLTLLDMCKELGIELAYEKAYSVDLPELILSRVPYSLVSGHEEVVQWAPRCIISLGGDGTMLNSALLSKDSGIPILGINLGRLGFLASVEKASIKEAIQLISQKNYSIQKRTMLYLETNLPLFGQERFAVNEFTILKRDNSSMITVHAYVNGEYLTSYWGDGVIVATPTGSTAYSLSCGGPIIFPQSGNFVITPVAPHNLSLRPIILSEESVISFEIEGRADSYLCTLDSRYEAITTAHQLAVRKCDFPLQLIKLPDFSFQKTMRDKLTWGKDQRN